MGMFLLRWLPRLVLLALLLGWLMGAIWLSHKRLPPGLHIEGPWQAVAAQDVRYLHDQTAADATGAPLVERSLDGEMLRMISRAREFTVIDTGLFGDLPAAGPLASRLRAAPTIAATLAEALLSAKREHPALQVLVLTDPSTVRMDEQQRLLAPLRAGGIEVLVVDVDRLRPPNPGFSAFWDLCCRWWSSAGVAGDWPNPLAVGPAEVSAGLWAELPGSQRSHRQVLIADDGAGQLAGLIFSRPLHAEASLHSASALRLEGRALEPLLESEFVVAQFSGWSGGGAMLATSQHLLGHDRGGMMAVPEALGAARARVVTEGAIATELVKRIDATGAGDSVDIAALYLSQRELVRALLDAARRGASVRVLLDPGKDGYGYARSGFPNRQVATELVAVSDGAVRVRWYRTHGEQFSPGTVLIRGTAPCWLQVGTPQLSRRDLGDVNLAAAFIVELPANAPACSDALSWFDTLWYNRAPGGTEYTSDVDVYADASQLRYWQYRLFEASGTSFD